MSTISNLNGGVRLRMSPVWWMLALCRALGCIIQCAPINQATCCPLSRSSSSSRAKPLSAISLHPSTGERKQRKDRRETLRGNVGIATQTQYSLIALTIWGIMCGRWSAILIRSCLPFLRLHLCAAEALPASLTWRGEDDSKDLLTFFKIWQTGSLQQGWTT